MNTWSYYYSHFLVNFPILPSNTMTNLTESELIKRLKNASL